MKFSFEGLLRFKPFEETEECLGDTYSKSIVVTAAVIITTVFAMGALTLAIVGAHDKALKLIIISLAITILVAGYEWHMGLKARSLNNIFSSLLYAFGVYLLIN